MRTALYNEHDPFAAEWLRSLIGAGEIQPGTVDARGIEELRPEELTGDRDVHLFAGIGGWPLALALAGWPATRPVWTGSCPCQPFSDAGKRGGESDARHLWPVMRELVRECRPATVFGEQVASAAGRRWLAGVRADLEGMGYRVGAADLCAAGAGAPHIRQRLFWVADAGRQRDARVVLGRRGVDEAGRGLEAVGPGQADADDPGRRTACGMADTGGEHPLAGGVGGIEEGSRGRWNQSSRGGTSLGLVDADRSGSQPGRGSVATARHGDAALTAGGAGRLADPAGERQQEHERRPWAGVEPDAPDGGLAGPWGDARLVACRDGKARRIGAQPGDEPLAHGLPRVLGPALSGLGSVAVRAARTNRVGRLKGYGNAIVPRVAAEFIRAFLDAERELDVPTAAWVCLGCRTVNARDVKGTR